MLLARFLTHCDIKTYPNTHTGPAAYRARSLRLPLKIIGKVFSHPAYEKVPTTDRVRLHQVAAPSRLGVSTLPENFPVSVKEPEDQLESINLYDLETEAGESFSTKMGQERNQIVRGDVDRVPGSQANSRN